jgi:hypothetical protein
VPGHKFVYRNNLRQWDWLDRPRGRHRLLAQPSLSCMVPPVHNWHWLDYLMADTDVQLLGVETRRWRVPACLTGSDRPTAVAGALEFTGLKLTFEAKFQP